MAACDKYLVELTPLPRGSTLTLSMTGQQGAFVGSILFKGSQDAGFNAVSPPHDLTLEHAFYTVLFLTSFVTEEKATVNLVVQDQHGAAQLNCSVTGDRDDPTDARQLWITTQQ